MFYLGNGELMDSSKEELEAYLADHGFVHKSFFGEPNGLRKKLADGYWIELVYGDFDEETEFEKIGFDLIAEPLRRIIVKLYENGKQSEAYQYYLMSGKDTKYLTGLANVLAYFENEKYDVFSKGDFENSRFIFANTKIFLDELVTISDLMSTKQGIFDFIYRNKFGSALIILSEPWVFLLLCKEIGLSTQEILKEVKMPYMHFHTKKWHLEKELDDNIIEIFSEVYDSVMQKEQKRKA